MISNNNPNHINNNSSEKVLGQNAPSNRQNSLQEHFQNGINNLNSAYSPTTQHTHTLSPGVNKTSHNEAHKDSIIRKYDDLFG